MNRSALAGLAVALAGMTVVSFNTGCRTLESAGRAATTIGVATGHIDPQQADAINRASLAFAKAFEAITPEQEYYLGRAVTATLVGAHKLYEHDAANRYIRTLGNALALFSTQPETFKGWHFAILDTDTINAFAAPGGFVLISRGLLRCCPNEEAVAAVLAHEIAHVQQRHGLRAIRTSRWTGAAQTAFVESARTLGSADVAELTSALESSIADITRTLVANGYSRRQEIEADRSAVDILQRAGYNPRGLQIMLESMAQRLPHHPGGFGATHPAPAVRLRELRSLLRRVPAIRTHPERQARFEHALAGI